MLARGTLLTLAFCALALAIAAVLGETYISRLPDHRGFELVDVADPGGPAIAARPRRTVVVVVDGLRADFASRMRTVKRIEERGRCLDTDVGPISVSRPVYAVISTGLEQDRTGARNNDEDSPLAAQSIWELAKSAGWVVSGVSDVPWWAQLFPRGFTRFVVRPENEDSFAKLELGDLTLVHPPYVDSAGHEHGAASPEYAAAVERADRELAELVDTWDFGQDLILVTADHGHTDRGGHGGPSPEVVRVLTCLAGPGVIPAAGREQMASRTIAPLLSVLLGLPFPKNMRAGEDELDVIFRIVSPDILGKEYFEARRQAVEYFRAENSAEIARRLGHPGNWSDVYREGRERQEMRGAVLLGIALLGAVFFLRRRALTVLPWIFFVCAATVVAHIWVRGSFDWSAINERTSYVRAGLGLCAGVAVLAAIVHLAIFRDRRRLLEDQLALVAVGVLINVGHVIVYGWPLGFPLPPPALLLLPFIASMFLTVHAILTALLALPAIKR